MFTKFEEGNIITKTRNNSESGDKSNDHSIMPPLLSEEEMYAIDSGDESYHDLISTGMLETFVTEVSLIQTLIK